MSNDTREFQICTPERALSTVRGNLRDAVIAIHRSLSMVNAVVSAIPVGQSQTILSGYMDGSGKILIYRYLASGNGTEFENWVDAYRQPARLLPEGAWQIRQFVYAAPPSGVLGEAVLTVVPYDLPAIDFVQESGARRKHFGTYIVDAVPLKIAGAPRWTAQFVIRDMEARMLGPIGIHAYYEDSDSAIETALSHAETVIDGGVALPEVPPS